MADQSPFFLKHPSLSLPKSEEMLPFSPNFWLGPGFDPIKEVENLARQINQPEGGSLEQTALYLDAMSASDWLTFAKQADHQIDLEGLPLEQSSSLLAHLYKEFYPTEELDLIALGPGGGEKEVRLAQHLLGSFKKLRLFLVDVSQPLLSTAYRHAVTALGDQSNVEVIAIISSMHHLQEHLTLFSPSKPGRRRCVVMMGYTFSNLDNELLFMRNKLLGLSPSDMFIIDVVIAAAPADKPEEIFKKEPRLNNKFPATMSTIGDKFLAGPFWRYCKGIKDIKVLEKLDTATCCIPGSYAIEKHFHVFLENQTERNFVVFRYKRYAPNPLMRKLKEEGWSAEQGWTYGRHQDNFLCLLRKTGS